MSEPELSKDELVAAVLEAFKVAGVPHAVTEARAAEMARELDLPWVALPKRRTMWDRTNLAVDFARRIRDKERSTK